MHELGTGHFLNLPRPQLAYCVDISEYSES